MTDYFNWLIKLIKGKGVDVEQYRMLLQNLFLTEYCFNNLSDKSRAVDGLALRKRFAYEKGIDREGLMGYMDGQCSVLEMLVAFAERIEDDYLARDEINRTYIWFWDMISSLALKEMTNDVFNAEEFAEKIKNFMVGASGNKKQLVLFPCVKSFPEFYHRPLWDQMTLWVNQKLKEV